MGLRVYGNRSYGQQLQNLQLAKKEKSGYYITVNFFKQTLLLVRFGWIDATDWRPQASPTGQMAGLPDDVYRFKLVNLRGRYQLFAPLRILPGIGPKTAGELADRGIRTIDDLLSSKGELPAKIIAIREKIRADYT